MRRTGRGARETGPPASATRGALYVLFLLSGFSGLIYESLWTHYLKLFLGHTAYAQSLVLAIFMGGLALGAGLASRLGERLPNLLRAYAAAEAAIGVYALAFPFLAGALEQWLFAAVIPAMPSPGAALVAQWGAAALLLLPAAVALGATFPWMSAALMRRYPGVEGRHLSMLYFTNSLGAAAGALVASFVLIDALGLAGTLTLAGALNLTVAAACAALARRPEAAAAAPAAPAVAAAAAAAPPPADLLRLVTTAALLTGAASFIYEVAWIRMLSLVLGSSAHAFELMLSAFITGLALGSLTMRSRLDRIADARTAAAGIQIAMGLLAMATLPVYAASFDWMGALVKALPRTDTGWGWFNLASHGIAFAVMLPATFLAGMTLPLFTHALLRSGHGERCIGRVYAANSVGAIAGVLFAVHLGLPLLGLKLSLALGATLDIALGLVFLWPRVSRAGAAGPPRWRTLALATLVVPVLVARGVTLDPAVLGSGVYRTGEARLSGSRMLFYRDGKTASIALAMFEDDAVISLSTNGKPDAALQLDLRRPSAPDEITMVLLGALPLSVHPRAEQVANIGFGSGMTTHVLLASPTVKGVASIEIEPAVLDAGRSLGARVQRAFEDPRSQLHVEDARSWFARHDRRFDLIISEPSNPWVSGVASLFTQPFYRRIRQHLAADGLLVQWLQLYEFDMRLLASVAKALGREFADYAVYDIDGSNLMILASPLRAVPAPTALPFSVPSLARELQRVSVMGLPDLQARLVGTKRDLEGLFDAIDAPVNTDDRPYVEQHAPRSRFLRHRALELPALAAAPWPIVEMLAPASMRFDPTALAPALTPRRRAIDTALQVHAVLTGSAREASEANATLVRLALARLGDCAALARPEALVALHELASATLAHLGPAALAPLWSQPRWLACDRQRWPDEFARRMALYGAVAERNAVAMAAAAAAALASSARGDGAWPEWALTAGMLGHRARGDLDGASALWRQHGPALFGAGRVRLEHLLLLRRGQGPGVD